MSAEPGRTAREDAAALASTQADTHPPLGDLPRLTSRQVTLDHLISRSEGFGALSERLFGGVPIRVGTLETLWRASGLNRPGVIVQLAWPRLGIRLGLGLDTPLAHAVTDHLLGFTRLPAEGHRQVTPVEWGILSFVFARALDRLDARPGPLGPWDMTIDRVGPDPFDARDLGPIFTWRWPARIGPFGGSIRLWVPESILSRIEEAPPPTPEFRPSLTALASTWRAEAGTITLNRGLARLKPGTVLPIDGSPLGGTSATPVGPTALICRESAVLHRFDTEAVPNTSSSRQTLTSFLRHEPIPREPLVVNPPPESPTAVPVDVPVTLVVELGRVNLPLSRIADMKPGDIVELGRHSREPVELTSNGRLIARGELVQIDTELGVRVTNVFL